MPDDHDLDRQLALITWDLAGIEAKLYFAAQTLRDLARQLEEAAEGTHQGYRLHERSTKAGA